MVQVPRECKNREGKNTIVVTNTCTVYQLRGSYPKQLQGKEWNDSFLFLTLDELKETLEELTVGMEKLAIPTAFGNGEMGKALYIWNHYRGDCWMNIRYLVMQMSSLEKGTQAKGQVVERPRSEIEACREMTPMLGTQEGP